MIHRKRLPLNLAICGLFIFLGQTGFADQGKYEIGDATHSDSTLTEPRAPQPPVAPNVDLKDVTPPPVPEVVPIDAQKEGDGSQAVLAPDDKLGEEQSLNSAQEQQEQVKSEKFIILGSEVPPSTATRLAWSPKVTITGLTIPTPVLVINGKTSGKTLCMTAAIHGDELNGVEIVRRVMYEINPEKLSGKIIGIPIVNLKGFQRASRYLPDRRDLNRAFPGDSDGSLAARIAHSLFNEVIVHCDRLIDLHTGSLRRTNLLQVRADMRHPDVVAFTQGFDETVVVHSEGEEGMLRYAALKRGIPAVTLEAGESLRLQAEQVEEGVKSIYSLLKREGMYSRLFTWGDPEPTYYQSRWQRAEAGGILFSQVELGDNVSEGEILGTVADPITNEVSEIIAPFNGRIIGMAVNQVVMPGFAAYHLGISSPPEECIPTPSMPENGKQELSDIKRDEGAMRAKNITNSVLGECSSE